ncbi:SNF2 family N-terminal domain-containing protein [Xylaria curta]|nr:SNF2 family N-terminal domain-containing protein [Xylaria curta]
MDANNSAGSLQPPVGSKRPSPSHDAEDREIKVPRKLPYHGNADGNDLDNPSWQLSNEHFGLSQQDVYRGHESQESHDLGGLYNDFSFNEVADHSLGSMPMTHQLPIDNFYPSSGDIDIHMGNTPFHVNQFPIRSLEETLPLINDSPSQTLAEPDLEETLDICNNYDTCFGVIKAIPTSSQLQNIETHSVISVKLKSFGSIFMLRERNSGSHLGILNDSKLVSVLNQLSLRLDATLLVSETKVTKEKRKSQRRKGTATEPTKECSIRIVLYGLRDNKEAIGSLFSDAGFFLQHPSAAELIPGVQYDNPHYFVRPGAEMPKLENLQLDDMNDDVQTEMGGEISKSRFMRILKPRKPMEVQSLHQVLALAMMQEKERRVVNEPMFPSLWRRELTQNGNTEYYRHIITRSLEPKPIPVMGGILADDMGLGKTLSMLALICSSLDSVSTIKDQSRNAKHQGTLIIAPKSTIYGWMTQVSEHINDGQLRVKIYHGPNRETLANQFQDTDVIITTYETLRNEWAPREEARPLFSWKWLRVVLDEAHHIRNRSSQIFQSVCDIQSIFRWCLTGTPIHNSLDDYGALLSFIRVFSLTRKSDFNSWIVKPMEKKEPLSVERLQALIQATCLRRIKEKAFSSNDLKLPLRFEKIHEVHLHQKDQDLYDSIKTRCAEFAAGLDERSEANSSPKSKEGRILLLINSLRLICDHGEQLLPDVMKQQNSNSSFELGMKQIYAAECSICEGEIDSASSITDKKDPICANCAASETGPQVGNMKAHFSDKSMPTCRPSAKVLALLENLKRDQTAAQNDQRPKKSVVFSYWVRMLDLVAQALQREQIGFQRINGQTTLDGRRKAMQEFNNNPNCIVLLASIGSSAEGVNLTVASTVHLLEPHWNPMVEAQAIDRVYRIGQTQQVTVIRYIVPNSVEIYVQKVQEEKMQLINHAINLDSDEEVDPESRRWEIMKEMLA